MANSSNATVVSPKAEKTASEKSSAPTGAEKRAGAGTESVNEKVVEKRRALGRGLDSLLPGPRPVPAAPRPSEPGSTSAANVPQTANAATNLSPSLSSPNASASASAGTAAGATQPGVIPKLEAVGESQPSAGVVMLATAAIDDNPHQTRSFFDEKNLEELSESIKAVGVLQPLVVRQGLQAGRYRLILGERRLRAAKRAGLESVPVTIRQVSEQQAAEMTVVENLQRQDLNCIEQALAFSNLSQKFAMTQEEIGKRVGTSRETVTNHLRLLRLPVEVQNALRARELSYSHARILMSLNDDTQILKLFAKAMAEKLSVAALEALVVENVPGEPKKTGARWQDPNVRAAQRSLETTLGMRVRISDRKGKGKITIEYGSLEDFDRVVTMLQGGR